MSVLCVMTPSAARAAVRTKKACRRETEEMVDRVGLPARSREPIADRDEITRLWLAERCFACLRCPRMVDRLARWHAGVREE